MMHRGYVKLWRKSVDSRVWASPELWKLWTWCLMRANRKKRFVPFKTGKGTVSVEIEKGQFVWGRLSCAAEFDWTPSTAKNRMDKLAEYGCITIKSNSQYSTVTVCNWESYQASEDEEVTPNEHPTDTQLTPNGHPTDTDKKLKELKELKEVKEVEPTPQSGDSGLDVFFLTKKKKKLTGKRLETFETFWNTFAYKSSKAEAADAWLEIPMLTGEIFKQILQAAEAEARKRPGLIAEGKTPKMAQGWITGRRWEDEGITELPQIDAAEQTRRMLAEKLA